MGFNSAFKGLNVLAEGRPFKTEYFLRMLYGLSTAKNMVLVGAAPYLCFISM